MKKLFVCILFFMLLFPLSTAQTLETVSGPELEVGLDQGFLFWTAMALFVRNIGDTPAYNITLSDFQINGSVLYNYRRIDWHTTDGFVETIDVLEPGEMVKGFLFNTGFFGFGTFTVTMTVTGDGEVTATGTGNGFIFGPFIFIP